MLFRVSRWALVSVLLLLITPALARGQESTYLTEFSEPGEQPVVNSVWSYLTVGGSMETVNVFQYGNVLVPFDSTTDQLLSANQTADFFTSFELRSLVASGVLSTNSFLISFQHSLTCEVAVPQIGPQLQGLAADQASSKLESILPDGAASVASALFDLGDKIGLIDGVDPATHALGVACYGGDLLESYAATQLFSCQQYIVNLRDFMTYQGMGADIEKCIPNAISGLQHAEYSPDVLIQYGETVVSNTGSEVSNAVQKGFCYIASCQTPPAHFDSATINQIISQVSTLSAVTPSLQSAQNSAQIDSQNTAARIAAKTDEAQTAISQLSTSIDNANAAIESHTGMTSILSALSSPPFNLSQALSERNSASRSLSVAETYLVEYRYNSAIALGNQGIQSADSSIDSVQAQETITRSPSWLSYVLVMVVIVVVVLFALLLRTFSSPVRIISSTRRGW